MNPRTHFSLRAMGIAWSLAALACALEMPVVQDTASTTSATTTSSPTTDATTSSAPPATTTDASEASSGAPEPVDTTTTTATSAATTESDQTTGAASFCGDAIVDDGEACDDGNAIETDGCLSDCTINPCGNGVLDLNEECDDGNHDGGDPCSPTCRVLEIVDVSVGGDHTCALFAAGNVRCWGQNESSQLCNGATEDLGDDPGELPVPDIFLPGPVAQLSSGAHHTCALLKTGNVHCWGHSTHGQLGYPDPATDAICDPLAEVAPQQVAVKRTVLAIAAGGLHTCVIILDERQVSCWGYSMTGQVGRGNLSKYDTPGILSDLKDVSELAAGGQHTCALMAGGEVRCWGDNTYGQLGIGSTLNVNDTTNLTPVANLADVAHITAGRHYTCALTTAGEVLCWGLNNFGQLGNGDYGANIGDDPTDEFVAVDLKASATAIALGRNHGCALLADSTVKCWGESESGSLGYGTKNDVRLPGDFAQLQPVDLGGPAIALRSSGGFSDPTGGSTCAVLADKSVRCWGPNTFGQLGLGHRDKVGDDETPDDPVHAGPVPY